ncbi:MAG: hypothetical protein QXW80_06945 [Candidatus Micrarchaeia archaeon]
MPGNTPLGLPTQGVGGLSYLPLASPQLLGTYNPAQPETYNTISNQQSTQSGQNTNTFLNGVSQFFGSLPSSIASTAAGLANWLIIPPGFTQGGSPLAGGAVPY